MAMSASDLTSASSEVSTSPVSADVEVPGVRESGLQVFLGEECPLPADQLRCHPAHLVFDPCLDHLAVRLRPLVRAVALWVAFS
jgi:hypothetical protein